MIEFLKLIDRKKATIILVLGLISGLINFLFIALINFMIGVVLEGKNLSNINNIILFCFLMLALIWSRRAFSSNVIKFSQQVFWNLRSEVLKIILKANYHFFSIRKDQIHSVLGNDVDVLTGFSFSIIQFLSALIITIGCFTYMGMKSPLLLLMTFGVSIFGALLYLIGSHFNEKKLLVSRALENKFMKNFLDILAGFKEIHMNPKIGKDIFDRKIRKISSESYLNNTEALSSFLNIQIIGEVLFYSLVAFILLFRNLFSHESPESVVNYIFILLYLFGNINTLTLIIPTLLRAKIASANVNKLKLELSDDRIENNTEIRKMSMDEFSFLRITDLMFSYRVENEKKEGAFSIGPLNISLEKGEVIFIYGGNGSGKTTMINVLLGIFESDSGIINFNGLTLNKNNYSEYRSIFSVVFSDFHLFDELYGFDHIPEDEINHYLKMFELTEKVSYANGAFTSNNLSTGQRKRLGLISALIHRSPVLVLDEWAADQDPLFRKKFYTQIIPKLKDKGFSIIAITHDDAYYHVADKLYKMEFGQLTLESSYEITKA